ncbi:hypothetical protein Agub_g1930 [Astrephomene gubernaculifera]|uniref:SAM-dependent MTase RsmB/NOP-type domain-containing protein n=1 Tax=Astrephomene gubernaculifera TaxID=47775 RepID=A0AAD3HI68_9CHLO|nr:hypothetical protein Agub_g1930 [Astrephomene gubernaculifera]
MNVANRMRSQLPAAGLLSAAHAPTAIAHRHPVSRTVLVSAIGSDDTPTKRFLVPRGSRRAPEPSQPVEQPLPPARRDERAHREEGRSARDGAGYSRDKPQRRLGPQGGFDRRRNEEHVRRKFNPNSSPNSDEREESNGSRSQSSSNELHTSSQDAPLDPLLTSSPRYLALQQLLRVEEGGAYVGLVNGSPGGWALAGAQGQGQGQGGRQGVEGGEGDEEQLEFGAELDDGGEEEESGPRQQQQRRRDSSYGGGGGGGEASLDPRSRRLLKELVAGVTRLQRRLDFLASRLSNQTPADWEPGVRLVLRLGLFELTERQLPPHALNEHVQLTKVLVRPGAAALVNGVLRAAGRALAAGTLPTPESELTVADSSSSSGSAGNRALLRRLAITHSHPTWLAARWLRRLGPDGAEALLARNNTPPVYSVRVNTLAAGPTAGAAGAAAGGGGSGGRDALAGAVAAELRAAGVKVEESRWLPGEFLRVRSGLQQLLAEGFVTRGSLSVQDESAGLVVALLDPQPGDRLLDCCAAPGGKTLFAAARMRGRGSITALDVSAARLRALRRAAEVAGAAHMVETRAADLREWAAEVAAREARRAREFRREDDEWERGGSGGGGRGGVVRHPDSLLYDKVLLDAPCTGTGVLSKRADLRWRRTPEHLEQLAALQGELLRAAAQLVAPGGVLVYSTCSIEEEENQLQVRSFLERHPEFELEPATPLGPTHGSPQSPSASGAAAAGRRGRGSGGHRGLSGGVPAEVITEEGFVATLPHVHDTDGAFAARLRRLAR